MIQTATIGGAPGFAEAFFAPDLIGSTMRGLERSASRGIEIRARIGGWLTAKKIAATRLFDQARPQDDAKEKHVRYLVDCIIGGQNDKFDELAELYRSQIYAVAWRYCSHREDALDITQNVLIRLYRALPGWKGRCRFGTWVHRITMNTAVDFYRRHLSHDQNRVDPEAVSADDGARVTSDPFLGINYETPRDVVQRHEVRQAVLDALPKLSEMQGKCFYLRYFHGLSVAEIAETAQCGEGSVKRHLFRASHRLRELLEHLKPMLEDGSLTPQEEL